LSEKKTDQTMSSPSHMIVKVDDKDQYQFSTTISSPAHVDSYINQEQVPEQQQQQQKQYYEEPQHYQQQQNIWYRRALLFVLYSCVASEALNVAILEPHMHSLVADHSSVLVRNVLRGLIIGAMYFGQFWSSSALGHASDLYGRKAFLVMAVMANYISISCFGLFGSWWTAALFRFVCGLFGSVTALSIAALTDNSAESPVKIGSLIAYTTGFISVAKAVSAWYHAFYAASYLGYFAEFDPHIVASVTAAILIAPSVVFICVTDETNVEYERPEKLLATDQDLLLSREFGFFRSVINLFMTRQFIVLTILLGLTALSISLGTRELLMHATGSVVQFGYGMNGFIVATIMSVFAVSIMLLQSFVYPKLIERFDLKKLYLVGTGTSIVAIALSFTSAFPYWLAGYTQNPGTKVAVGALLSIYLILALVGYMLMVPTLNTMLHAVTLKSQGISFGTTYSIVCLAYAISPFIAALLSTFGRSLSFPWLCAFTSLSALVIAFTIGILGLEQHYIDSSENVTDRNLYQNVHSPDKSISVSISHNHRDHENPFNITFSNPVIDRLKVSHSHNLIEASPSSP
jgi:MFS family permease